MKWFSRDASFLAKPNTRTAKVVHLQHPESISRFGHSRALCGNIALIDSKDYGEFPNPTESMKCKRCLRCMKNLELKHESQRNRKR